MYFRQEAVIGGHCAESLSADLALITLSLCMPHAPLTRHRVQVLVYEVKMNIPGGEWEGAVCISIVSASFYPRSISLHFCDMASHILRTPQYSR
jgi:citrate lyase alpha subunit